MFQGQQLPSFGGATGWLNSEALGPAELKGHVVLVDFWTLTCINWLRTVPYLRAWYQAYAGDGLSVIGVHTPEFEFEHETDLVRQAVKERGLDYPIALDNDYGVWSAFDNHYWPALYFADDRGMIRDHHFGEGRYVESERTIQRLLGIEREPVAVAGTGVEAPADWNQLRTPETYLGYGRGGRLPGSAGLDDRQEYQLPGRLAFNSWALGGRWTVRPEFVVLDEPGGSVAFRFQARDAHLVLAPGASDAVPFRVLLDGEAPGRSHGVDVDEDGNGVLREGRMYQLVRQYDAVLERTVEIRFDEAGVEAYVFTFG
ncbi:redoxin domain-containing protein [Kribbella sp. NPDC049227]|uniref:redoxin domain-containing protein n=1 Tax=Kribbella sp. NPDC049227 TaxID=3364113 RepID=UPI0037112ABC